MIRYCLLQKGNSVNLNVFSEHFSSIEDTRQSAKVTYPLFDVLFLTLCAVISGCQGWADIEDFGESRLAWLQKLGFFALGVPVHDAIARIIARIEPSQLQHCFANWMQAVTVLTDGEVVAIGGKTLCSSYNRKSRRSAIHMVSAFASANGVVSTTRCLNSLGWRSGRPIYVFVLWHLLNSKMASTGAVNAATG